MRPADEALAASPHPGPETALYDVVLLAGSPRRLRLRLERALAAEAVIEVDGEPWLIADVRPCAQGTAQLICIHDT